MFRFFKAIPAKEYYGLKSATITKKHEKFTDIHKLPVPVKFIRIKMFPLIQRRKSN